jgi:plasmid stabilization system protein ParE
MLEEAVEYIALASPAAAHRLAMAVVAAADSLSELSERGRSVPELDDPLYRELFVSAYRLIYRVEDEQVVSIIAVVHGARDFRSWWMQSRQERLPN